MVEYSKVNVKLTDTQLKKLKTAVKNKTGTTRQKTKWRNAFNNIMSTDLKLTRAQFFKIIKSGGILGSLLNKLAGPLMKVAIPLAKTILAPLGIRAAASANYAGIQKKIHGFGTRTLIILNEEINDIIKIVQDLEDSNMLLKGVTKTIENETKKQKRGFLSMLLGILGATLFGNLLAGKDIVRAGSGNKKGKGIVRAGSGKQWDF